MMYLFITVAKTAMYEILMGTEWMDALNPPTLPTHNCSPPVDSSTENRTAILSTRPEDILDPGDGAAGVSPAGSGASGGSV